MNFEDFRGHDAVGLAERVARRDVSPDELLDAVLARMDAVNGRLNAVIATYEAEARAAIKAGLPDGPLKGVPYPIKDISVHMAGKPTGAGSRLFRDLVVENDSAIVAAYRRAGLVLFGKTNTPEFGIATVTEPVANGATLNPWNEAVTPGGSSGGASAAVAAGIVPAAHGSDGGGSIRTPASCCGLFGLKPSRGRVSLSPAGEGWGGLSVQHALTRSVRDSATLLDIACQPQPGDPYWLEPPARPFASEVRRDPGRLQIGFTTDALIWGELFPENVKAVRDAARLCEALGHHVEEARPDVDFQQMALHANTAVSSATAANLENEAARRGAPIREDEVETLTWQIYQTGLGFSGVQVAQAIQHLHALSRRLAAFFERYDILLLATNGKPPQPKGSIDMNAADLSDYAERLYSFIPNTQPFNVGGQPAMSVPLAWTDDGLPIGVQFVARGGAEALLFRLAGQLERAQPWFHKVPAL
ncbi:MAG: amidase [Phenylobacterium sp.]|uniref:amidase n=1 Tax=Phenylobacterium sp. TaxID=1871053 RepID=UPI001A4FC9ED|nr:amidase [Phenylobacterium sp.]MBL8772093.1 amidase [Phenylobacterium sp.]